MYGDGNPKNFPQPWQAAAAALGAPPGASEGRHGESAGEATRHGQGGEAGATASETRPLTPPTVARVASVPVLAEHVGELAGRYEAKVLPVLEASEGWREVQLLYDEAKGAMVTVSLWEDGEALAAVADDAGYRDAMREIADLMEGVPEVVSYKVVGSFRRAS